MEGKSTGDPMWDHVVTFDSDEKWMCRHCNKWFSGGPKLVTAHVRGISGQGIEACTGISRDVPVAWETGNWSSVSGKTKSLDKPLTIDESMASHKEEGPGTGMIPHLMPQSRDVRWKKKARYSSSKDISMQRSSSTLKSSLPQSMLGFNEVFLSYAKHQSSTDLASRLNGLLDSAEVRLINSEHDVHKLTALEERINRCRIYVPLICEDYMSTPDCLTELQYMSNAWKLSFERVILPIFHDLEPFDILLEKSPFKRAMTTIENTGSRPSIREAWKGALNVVARMSGWVLTQPCSEEVLVLIAQEVASIIHPKFPKEGPYLVGIDRKVEQIMNLLNVEVNDKRVISIRGIGGIGKTTLAKVVYSRLSACFEGCCFVRDIRETFQQRKNCFQYLQTKLISGILRRECDEITSADEGISYMREVFFNMKVLIVLDDVDARFNLEQLVGKLDTFGPGSRIIVTSRYETDLSRADWTFDVPELCRWEVQLLFNSYAEYTHLSAFYELAAEIVSVLGGLPLVVEVIGSFLYLKGVAVWKETLQKLKRMHYKEEKEPLVISYEALDAHHKEMFLDIACSVNGEDLQIASYMWHEFSTFWFSGGKEYRHLRSLVKVGDNNELHMHDELRELGRRIAHQGGYTNLQMENRPRTTGRIYGMFNRVKGKQKVEALNPQSGDPSAQHRDTDALGLESTRFLKGEHPSTTKYDAFPDLRWLQLHKHPRNCEEVILFPKRLVILDISWSNITESWEGWEKIKTVKSLKVLKLTGCNHLIKTPDFSGYPDLEVLILERCCHLVKIDPSIHHLQKLASLNLNFCTEISTLPEELGSMKALKELLIDGTSVQEIPASVGHIEALQTLSASGCLSLNQLPISIGYLRSLSTLSLDHARITEIPSSIKELEKLQKLSLRNCRLLGELPITFGEMGFPLCELDITKTGISELPVSIGRLSRLRVLKLESCFIEEFPSTILELGNLEEIHASYCRSLTMFIRSDPDSDYVAIRKLRSLKILRLGFSRISWLPENFHDLPRLKTLDLRHCNMLRKLPYLPYSITSLRYTCKGMEKPWLYGLHNLKELLLADTDTEELIRQEPDFREHTFWSDGLQIQGSDSDNGFSLVNYPRLRVIEFFLSGVSDINFSFSSSLPHSVKKIVLSCVNLKRVSRFPPTLVSLTLQHCWSLKSMCVLGLKSLKELNLDHCAVREISGLHELKALEILKVCDCRVNYLPGLEELTSLRSMTVSHCDQLLIFPDLSDLKTLVELHIDNAPIHRISGLHNLQALEILKVTDCKVLGHLEGLEELTSLRSLEVSQCECLIKLPDLPNLKMPKVAEIPGDCDD